MIAQAISKLAVRADLTEVEVAGVMDQIADGGATPAQIGAFLLALRMKGETVEEIVGAARVMRARAERIRVTHPVFIDTCGTGGGARNTFNISTGAAFVVAAGGVPVAKHGNRAVSSRCGSADVLPALGVKVDVPKELVEEAIAQLGVGFLFAPLLHPAFKAAGAVRRELGVRTVFNLLGPLVNPAGARHQVMGVYEPAWVPKVADVLARLGAVHALVVHGDETDELSVTGDTQVCEVRSNTVVSRTVQPEELGLRRWAPAEVAGGDAERNARILRDVLGGQKGAPRDAVIANAAAGLLVGGAAATLEEGARLAEKTVDSGAAARKLEALAAFTSRATGAG